MNIPISTAKRIREELQAEAVVIFAAYRDEQSVATHGATPEDADAAAQMGNRLKVLLGWPAPLCEEKPLPRICRNCKWWDHREGPARFGSCTSPRVCWTDEPNDADGTFERDNFITAPNFGCIHFDPK